MLFFSPSRGTAVILSAHFIVQQQHQARRTTRLSSPQHKVLILPAGSYSSTSLSSSCFNRPSRTVGHSPTTSGQIQRPRTKTTTAPLFLNADEVNKSTSSSHHKASNTEAAAESTTVAIAAEQQNLRRRLVVVPPEITPRVRAFLSMGIAMILHFGGYELMRNSCLSLLTSTSTSGDFNYGFSNPAIYPFLTGLISPFSLILFLLQTRLLEKDGPRISLRKTTIYSLAFILSVVSSLYMAGNCFQSTCSLSVRRRFAQVILGIAFLFQNSYQHLLYTQHWSFLSSIVSADEGRKFFSVLNGCSTLFSSFIGALIPLIVPQLGLLGLMSLTSVFLLGSFLCGEYAYSMSAKYPGFDPTVDKDSNGDVLQQEDNKKKQIVSHNKAKQKNNRIAKTYRLFRRVPTLQALLMEVITYQGISTILNVAFARSLQQTITDDVARSSYMGKFYSLINAVSTCIQLMLLPLVLRKAEHSTLWKITPILPMVFCAIQATRMSFLGGAQAAASSSTLGILSIAFFLTKVMDYAFRTTTYIMVYQPLDYESRYFGSETINLLGGRFGKSGTSLFLSGMTVLGKTSLRSLIRMATLVGALWTFSCSWLSKIVPSQAEAQRIIQQRGSINSSDTAQQHQQHEEKEEKKE